MSAALIASLVLTSFPASAAQVTRLAGRGVSMPLGGLRMSRGLSRAPVGAAGALKPALRISAGDLPLLPESMVEVEGDSAGYHWGKAAGEKIRLSSEEPNELAALDEDFPRRSGLTLHDWGRVAVHRAWIGASRVLRGISALLRR